MRRSGDSIAISVNFDFFLIGRIGIEKKELANPLWNSPKINGSAIDGRMRIPDLLPLKQNKPRP
jgi:hypothetical protein